MATQQMNLKQVIKILKQHLLIDKGIWKWCAVFTGVYIGSRLFFYRFYYPSILRTFSPPSFFESNRSSISHRLSISNAFPQALLRRLSVEPLHSDSLYSQTTRRQNSESAAGKLMSLTHAILTVYKGIHCMSKLGITPTTLSLGVDYIQPPIKTNNPIVLDMINMNTSYAIADLLIVYLPNPKNNILFVLHHIVVVFAGVTFKYLNRGSAIMLLIYYYSDIPTVLLHTLWFARNIGMNLKSLFALFNKQSVKDSQYLVDYQNIDQDINANINILSKVEKVLFVGFTASFFYFRCVVFTKVFPLWIKNSWKSPNYTKNMKYAAVGVSTTLLGIGYLWSFKLILKIKEIITSNDNNEMQQEIDEQIMNNNRKLRHLESVDEQEAEP